MKDRVQELWIESECGGRFVINIGVGQGTVLGPTLFKIYIADMLHATKLFSLRFADDSNLIGMGKNREETERDINSELEKLYNWFCQNKLTLKCTCHISLLVDVRLLSTPNSHYPRPF